MSSGTATIPHRVFNIFQIVKHSLNGRLNYLQILPIREIIQNIFKNILLTFLVLLLKPLTFAYSFKRLQTYG